MVKHTSAYLDLAIIKAPTTPNKGTFYEYRSRKKVDIYETWKSLACVLPSEVRTEYQTKEMVHTQVNTIVIVPRLKCSVFFFFNVMPMFEIGFIKLLRKKWWTLAEVCDICSKTEWKPVSPIDVQGAFYVAACNDQLHRRLHCSSYPQQLSSSTPSFAS